MSGFTGSLSPDGGLYLFRKGNENWIKQGFISLQTYLIQIFVPYVLINLSQKLRKETLNLILVIPLIFRLWQSDNASLLFLDVMDCIISAFSSSQILNMRLLIVFETTFPAFDVLLTLATSQNHFHEIKSPLCPLSTGLQYKLVCPRTVKVNERRYSEII